MNLGIFLFLKDRKMFEIFTLKKIISLSASHSIQKVSICELKRSPVLTKHDSSNSIQILLGSVIIKKPLKTNKTEVDAVKLFLKKLSGLNQ